ncbi:high-affinity branched-chain amino acid ABC transporter permease LivM [Comamonas endophytica]|uniref:High-affinity branched-chain amino acid ABC transporter permease LivM n=1 Tax=Comamonas endophytica TaxID=2949090 RepID=A0ABY6GAR4_9BURK|nr:MULTISPECIES: high-affinity branched-chain amino acid ABC transporter permease LivM [unclassified Acidovorax]MCD2512030.1 high-affinity branched-chain amino acid ABC transporter permease LivM [Acidovorax sp. D4N7]UYG51810.1 high-affinity branched-chain amino acid ABC transporter permease LivM [Acidovorax sp. 5MLIR]
MAPASVSRDTLRSSLRDASIASVLTALVTVPIFGLHLERAGTRTVIAAEWTTVAWACALVFAVQLLRPWLARAFAGVPRLQRPALPATTARQRQAMMLAALLIAVSWPFFAGRNAVDIATLAMIYVMLGLGLNIVVGFAGLLDLGFVGFYAVGAYTYALLFHWAGWSFWEALPLAGAVAAGFGCVLGFPVLRLRGDYLAIVTLGFGEIIRLLLINLTGFTGGPDGISGIPKPTVFGLELTRSPTIEGGTTFHQFFGLEFQSLHMVVALYLMALALALVTLWISSRLIRMPIGRAWEALREDEIASRSLGLHPMKIKLSAFTLGAMFAGLGGAFFAARQGIVNPESFTFIESALILAIVVLGGMGSQLGVIIAAIVLTVLPELAREFSEYRMLIFGLVMILMMVWRPQGLLPMQRPHLEVGP